MTMWLLSRCMRDYTVANKPQRKGLRIVLDHRIDN